MVDKRVKETYLGLHPGGDCDDEPRTVQMDSPTWVVAVLLLMEATTTNGTRRLETTDHRGGGIMKLGAMPKKASGGGDKKKPKKDKKPDDDIVYGPRPGGVEYGPGPGTDDVVDNSGMNWWTNNGPITPGQSMNPLVDPNGWQYQADPNDGYIHDLGRYVAPGLLIPKKKGALV